MFIECCLGKSDKQSTDTHYYSSGDAEFNWRMIWPGVLPEALPRLFLVTEHAVRDRRGLLLEILDHGARLSADVPGPSAKPHLHCLRLTA